jgi:uncharacterized DUF497 family protein
MAFRFEWNSRKAEANLRKHGVSFDEAELVFRDPFKRLDIEGDDHGEIRWHTIGEIDGKLYVVVHTIHEEGDVEAIRIISVRRCTRGERQRYEEAP